MIIDFCSHCIVALAAYCFFVKSDLSLSHNGDHIKILTHVSMLDRCSTSGDDPEDAWMKLVCYY